MTTLIQQSGRSFEQLCAQADAFRDQVARIIDDAEAEIDAADPVAEDYRRRLRRIAFTLDDVPIPKMMALALLNEEGEGALLDMIAFALGPQIIDFVEDAAALVALYDDDVAEFSRQIDRQGFH